MYKLFNLNNKKKIDGKRSLPTPIFALRKKCNISQHGTDNQTSVLTKYFRYRRFFKNASSISSHL